MYGRRVVPSGLAFSLSSHRHFYMSSVNELSEESDQFRFLRPSCFTNLKGTVRLIMTKVSVIRIPIPLDLSSRSFIPLPRFIRSCRPTPLLVGILVDSEIVLSTRYGKTRVFINKTLSTETAYQQDLINRDLLSTRLIVGKVGPGMWCGKISSTSNVLVCETQRKVNMYGCVSE